MEHAFQQQDGRESSSCSLKLKLYLKSTWASGMCWSDQTPNSPAGKLPVKPQTLLWQKLAILNLKKSNHLHMCTLCPAVHPRIHKLWFKTHPKFKVLWILKQCKDINSFLFSDKCRGDWGYWLWHLTSMNYLKGIVYPKMKILSLITHPHVVPNP